MVMLKNVVEKVKHILLPGPIEVDKEVLVSASYRPISHRSKEFVEIYRELISMLKKILKINKGYLITIPGSSTVGIEASFNNIVSQRTRVLVLDYGFFGYRLYEMARRHTKRVTYVRYSYTSPPTKEELLGVIEKNDFDVLALVHNETSNGYVVRFLDEIAKIVYEKNAYMIVDGVSSVGAEPIDFDNSGIDLLITGSQKALGGIPGLSIVAISKRVYQYMLELKEKGYSPLFYLDIPLYIEEFNKYGWTPSTPPVNVVYALHTSLKKILEYGVDNYIRLHSDRAKRVYEYAVSSGFNLMIQDHYYRSNTVAVIDIGSKAMDIVNKLKEEYGIYVSPGLGDVKDRVLRIGMMGFIDINVLLYTIDLIKKLKSTG